MSRKMYKESYVQGLENKVQALERQVLRISTEAKELHTAIAFTEYMSQFQAFLAKKDLEKDFEEFFPPEKVDSLQAEIDKIFDKYHMPSTN